MDHLADPITPEDTRCAICLHVMVSPVTCPCGHAFDGPCLARTADPSDGRMRCPLCREEVPEVPGQSILLRRLIQATYPSDFRKRRVEIESSTHLRKALDCGVGYRDVHRYVRERFRAVSDPVLLERLHCTAFPS